MSKNATVVNSVERTLLSEMSACMGNLIDSAFLDATDMANDCLEVFEAYEWEPLETLNDEERARWEALKDDGDANTLGVGELSEFIDLTSDAGEVHAYFYRVKARKLINEVASLEAGEKQSNSKYTRGIQDWRVGEGEPVPESEAQEYQLSVDIGNQVSVEITDADGEPSLGLFIEINKGVPAVHIDADGGDSLIHIHKAQGGIVLSPDCYTRPLEAADVDQFTYHEDKSVRVRN